MTTRRRRTTIWKRIQTNWFQIAIGLAAIIHSIAWLRGMIDITTFGGSFGMFVTTIASIKSALKDDND